jgi:DNA uptake protein ComE-like DNA-binding protein
MKFPMILKNSAAKCVAAMLLVLVLVFSSVRDGSAQLGKQSGLLDPNIATEQQLALLAPLNAALAKTIIEKRPFLKMTELNGLLSPSLSKDQLTQLYGKLFLHINLNTASRDEILLIPGIGPKMAHEFEEYRPYRTLEQFRKEMGKYVNAQEVARLEQYVFIPMNLNTASDADLSTIPGLGSKMLHEFKEYRPYRTIEQFRREIGKYVNAKEVARLERYITIN